MCAAADGLALAAVTLVVVAAAFALRSGPGGGRGALALVEVSAVLGAASVVALAAVTGASAMLADAPTDALSRLAAVLALVGARAAVTGAETPGRRDVVARVVVPALVPASVMTAVALWRWLGWERPCAAASVAVVGVAAAVLAVAAGAARWRAGSVARADRGRDRTVDAVIADRAAG